MYGAQNDILANPVFKRLDAVKEDRVIYLDLTDQFAGALGFASALSLPYLIDEAEERSPPRSTATPRPRTRSRKDGATTHGPTCGPRNQADQILESITRYCTRINESRHKNRSATTTGAGASDSPHRRGQRATVRTGSAGRGRRRSPAPARVQPGLGQHVIDRVVEQRAGSEIFA